MSRAFLCCCCCTHGNTLAPTTHTPHSTHTEAIGTGSPKQALKDIKDKAKGAIKGNSSLATPNSLATVADLNADVRGAADNYRDPAIATPQDKAGDKLEGGCAGWWWLCCGGVDCVFVCVCTMWAAAHQARRPGV